MLAIKEKLIIILIFVSTTVSAEISQISQLKKLFDNLGKVSNYNDANLIQKKIWSIWNEHPNDIGLTNKLELGTDLMYEGNYQFALKVFNNIIKSDPNWSEAWNKRATLLFLMNDYKNSLSDIDQVLNIEPRHFGALSGRAQIFIAQQKYQKAINDLKKVQKINPIIGSDNLILELQKLIKGLSI